MFILLFLINIYQVQLTNIIESRLRLRERERERNYWIKSIKDDDQWRNEEIL